MHMGSVIHDLCVITYWYQWMEGRLKHLVPLLSLSVSLSTWSLDLADHWRYLCMFYVLCLCHDWLEWVIHRIQVSLRDHCRYQYLVNVAGATYSARLKYLLACGSPVIQVTLFYIFFSLLYILFSFIYSFLFYIFFSLLYILFSFIYSFLFYIFFSHLSHNLNDSLMCHIPAYNLQVVSPLHFVDSAFCFGCRNPQPEKDGITVEPIRKRWAVEHAHACQKRRKSQKRPKRMILVLVLPVLRCWESGRPFCGKNCPPLGWHTHKQIQIWQIIQTVFLFFQRVHFSATLSTLEICVT